MFELQLRSSDKCGYDGHESIIPVEGRKSNTGRMKADREKDGKRI